MRYEDMYEHYVDPGFDEADFYVKEEKLQRLIMQDEAMGKEKEDVERLRKNIETVLRYYQIIASGK